MLEKVNKSKEIKGAEVPYLHFNTIASGASGTGQCYVYNAILKHTREGKPFVTLFLRDIDGTTLPCYVFDIQSPLIAGKELNEVCHRVVSIEWEENYIPRRGLTLRANHVGLVTDTPPEVLSWFTGAIEKAAEKQVEIEKFTTDILGAKVTLPPKVNSVVHPSYTQGKMGGLLEHYWRMKNIVTTMTYLPAEDYKKLVATFVLYIYVHSNFVVKDLEGKADISFITDTAAKTFSLIKMLNLGEGAKELVSVLFSAEPKDIYVRSIVSISENVKRLDAEFSCYRTIPLQQEGNAGYGTIRRYEV